MAIRFGMTLAEIIGQLTRGFTKMMGRNPEALEKIKIQQEAIKRFKDMNKVVDMEGKSIDTSKGIMGGKQIQESPEFGKKIKETYDKAKGPGEGKKMVDALKSPGAKKSYEIMENQLGVKLYGDETFEEILQIQKTGKHPRGEPKADGGRIGYKDGMLKRGLKAITDTDTYKTLENRGFNAAVLMSEGFDQIYNLLSGVPGLAEGGRIGYKDGPDKPGRRKFMKMAAGIASLIPGLGMIGKGAKVAAPVVAKAAEITGPALAKLVDTVMSAGKLISLTGTRVKNMVTKKKLGKVEVEEDIADGSYIIKKDGKEIYYKPGRMDESGIEDDIIEVIEDRVKKAGGGIGYMLGE
jgi:hypothetical protein